MKSTLSALIRAAVVAVAVLSYGCDTQPNRVPRSTQAIVLTANHVMADVPIGVVTAIVVVLPLGPEGSSGDVWEIASNNNKVLEQTSGLRAGAAGTTTVSFYALRPGRSVLRFVLVHPGEAEAVPAAMCEVTVRVSG
jgi:hypothetical protein